MWVCLYEIGFFAFCLSSFPLPSFIMVLQLFLIFLDVQFAIRI